MADLIRMKKDGVVMDVHPDALKEHLRLHWVLAPDETIVENIAAAPIEAHSDVSVEEAQEARRGPGRPRKIAE